MAKSGQKFNSYTVEFKKRILEEYFSGQCGRDTLAKRYGVSSSTIYNWIKKTKDNIDISVDGRGSGYRGKGRPKSKNLSLEYYKERYEILKKTRPSTMFVENGLLCAFL